jgi:hypothetical protein
MNAARQSAGSLIDMRKSIALPALGIGAAFEGFPAHSNPKTQNLRFAKACIAYKSLAFRCLLVCIDFSPSLPGVQKCTQLRQRQASALPSAGNSSVMKPIKSS